jgi:hypothetical protein
MKRRAFSILEILVAIGLAAGPLLLAVHLVQSNVSGAKFNQERGTARLVLLDILETLLGEPVELLRAVAGTANAPKLDRVLEERITSLPDEAQKSYREQSAILRGKLSATFEENISPDTPGLARLTLTAKVDERSTVTLVRLFRPAMRPRPQITSSSGP